MNIATDPRFSFQYRWFFQLTEQLMQRYVLPRFEKHQGPINYIETGVCEGASLVWALENFGRHEGLFVGIDPFLNSRHWHEGEGNGHQRAAMRHLSNFFDEEITQHEWNGGPISQPFYLIGSGPICELHPIPSEVALLREYRRFHIAYCDGCHNADIAILDIILLFRLLHDGGVLIVDDYDRKVRGGRPQVYPAVKAFEACYEGFYDVLFEHQRAIGFVKRPRRRRGFPPVLECGPVLAPTAG